MKKKFICPICGFVFEGEQAPERCPQCKQVVTWKEVDENAGIAFACEHVIGVAKDTDEQMKADLNAHFMGEATEVGMYLACRVRLTEKAILRLQRLSNAMPSKKLNTAPSLPNCSVRSFGIPRPTSRNV